MDLDNVNYPSHCRLANEIAQEEQQLYARKTKKSKRGSTGKPNGNLEHGQSLDAGFELTCVDLESTLLYNQIDIYSKPNCPSKTLKKHSAVINKLYLLYM